MVHSENETGGNRHRGQVLAVLLLSLGFLGCGPVLAQQPDDLPSASAPAGTFLINLRDADIRLLCEQVSEITGRTLVLDPDVTGNVTVISSEPLGREGVWDLFQTVLAAQGLATLPTGSLWRVTSQQTARDAGAGELTDGTARLDIITRLVALDRIPAASAAGALRPLLAPFGYIEAIADTNTIVITDTADNVRRLEVLALALDGGSDQTVVTLRIANADAAELAATLRDVAGDRPGTDISVDSRSNTLIVRGDSATIGRVQSLVSELDVPGRPVVATVPMTRVYSLQFADATSLATVLQGLVSGGVMATNPVAAALAPGSGDANGTPDSPGAVQSLANEDITIQPVPESNSVVIRARAEVHADLGQLIASLDQRRPQVLIEAAIVEISGDISEQLGVQLGLGAAAPPGSFAATSFSNAGPALENILRLLGSGVRSGVSSGLSIGLSRQDEFGLLIQAFGQSTKARLLSTPSVTTLDNEAAEILVGQNVPFRTGSFSGQGGSQNPFTTIERQDVGIKMNVVPRVNLGDVVQLEISQEVSSLLNTSVTGAADLITNRRSISTTVLADNGGTIVLGGLITDDRQSARGEVPGLGDLPLVGGLFRSRQEAARRQTLFIFLRPTILRTRDDVSNIAENRFERLRAIDTTREGTSGRGLLASPAPAPAMRMEIDGLY